MQPQCQHEERTFGGEDVAGKMQPCEMIIAVRDQLQLAMANLDLLFDHRLDHDQATHYAERIKREIRTASEKLTECAFIKNGSTEELE